MNKSLARFLMVLFCGIGIFMSIMFAYFITEGLYSTPGRPLVIISSFCGAYFTLRLDYILFDKK